MLWPMRTSLMPEVQFCILAQDASGFFAPSLFQQLQQHRVPCQKLHDHITRQHTDHMLWW